MYNDLVDIIFKTALLGFASATDYLIEHVNSTENLLDIIQQIGIIPESIDHDSTEEKLFSKASDAVLSRVFQNA
jgi:type II restriction enzyme